MSAPFKDATNDAVQFLTKHGDLTRAAAYDAIRLLTGNGFVVTQTDMLPSATDLSQAAVAAALEAAAEALQKVADNWDCGHNESRLCDCAPYVDQWGLAADEVRALITPDQHVARAAAMARADQARDAALVEALSACKRVAETAREYNIPQMVMGANKCHDDISDLRIQAHAILALRDKPAPEVTVRKAILEVWGCCEELEDEALAKLSGVKTEHEKGFWTGQKMTAKRIRRATQMPIAGGGDE